jgi:hypothetical protein
METPSQLYVGISEIVRLYDFIVENVSTKREFYNIDFFSSPYGIVPIIRTHNSLEVVYKNN